MDIFSNSQVMTLQKICIYYINNPQTCKDRKDKSLKSYANKFQNTVLI